jgi:hypothetical protein
MAKKAKPAGKKSNFVPDYGGKGTSAKQGAVKSTKGGTSAAKKK